MKRSSLKRKRPIWQNKDGTPKKVLGTKSLKARKLASALKSVAPNKKKPK